MHPANDYLKQMRNCDPNESMQVPPGSIDPYGNSSTPLNDHRTPDQVARDEEFRKSHDKFMRSLGS